MCEEALKAMRGTHTTMHGIRQSCKLPHCCRRNRCQSSVCALPFPTVETALLNFSGQATNGVNARHSHAALQPGKARSDYAAWLNRQLSMQAPIWLREWLCGWL